MKFSEAEAAVDIEWDKLKNFLSCGLKASNTQGMRRALDRTKKTDWLFILHPSVVFALWCATCETPTEVQRKSRALGETSSRTSTVTKQYSRSKAHQLLTWRQQDFWIQCPYFPVWQRSQRHGIGHTRMCICRKLPDC